MRRILLSLLALLTLLCGRETIAQEYHRPALSDLLERGQYDSLCDSVKRGDYPEKTKAYYTIWCRIHQANYREAEQVLRTFSRREQSSAALLIPKVHIDLALGRRESAEKSLAQLQKVHTKDEALLKAIEQTKRWYDDYRRMAANTASVEVLDRYTGEESGVRPLLEALTAGSGKVLEKAFETEEGSMRILVLRRAEQQEEYLAVSYRLGDGRWEDPQEIKVSGLPSGRYWYPMLLSDGVTLRFAFAAQESGPGADLYVTRWDKGANQLLVPQRLSFPYNSEADDLLYGTTAEGEVSYLLSRRWSEGEGLKLFLLRERADKARQEEMPGVHAILLDSVSLTHPGAVQEYLAKLSDKGERERVEPVFFTWGGKPVRSEKDLQSPSSRQIFGKYRRVLQQYLQDVSSLESLRREYAAEGKPAREAGISKQIRTLEQEILRKEEALKALRNEIIREEGGE